MDESPDSSLVLLDSINPADLHGDADNALYALLMTQSRVKLNMEQTDDSLISVAVDYFSPKKDLNAVKSLFYRGTMYVSAGKFEAALIDYLEARDISRGIDNEFWRALAMRGLGDTYCHTHDYRLALDYYKKSYAGFTRAGKDLYANYGLHDLGRAWFSIDDHDSCIAVLGPAEEYARQHGKESLRQDAVRLKGMALLRLHRYAEAAECFQDIERSGEMKAKDFSDYLEDYGVAMVRLGNLEKARELEERLKSVDPEKIWLSYEILRKEGKHAEAVAFYDKEIAQNNETLHEAFTSVVPRIIENFVSLKAEAARERQLEERRITLCVFLIAFFIFILLLVLYRQKRRNMQADMERNLAVARSLRTDLSLKENIISSLTDRVAEESGQVNELREILDRHNVTAALKSRERVRELLSSRFNMIDIMCDRYFQSENTAKGKRGIYESVMSVIQSLGEDSGLLLRIEEIVNAAENNLVARLRSEVKDLTPGEVRLFLFLYVGFSSRSISSLLGISINAVYNRKSSLKKKIQASDVDFRQQVVSIIDSQPLCDGPISSYDIYGDFFNPKKTPKSGR